MAVLSAQREAFRLGALKVPAGRKATGSLPLSQRLDGSPVGIPLMICHGARPGPVLLVDAGTHGDEMEGIIAVQQFAAALSAEELCGTTICIPGLNYLAVELVQRELPDIMFGTYTGDLNRVFPGSASATLVQRLASLYAREVIPRADVMVSCHGGGVSNYISPKILYSASGPTGFANSELAKAFGWEILCKDDGGYPGTSQAVAQALGIPVIVAEHGGGDRLPPQENECVRRIIDGLNNVLRHLEMLPGAATYRDEYIVCGRNLHLHAPNDGMVRYAEGINVDVDVTDGQPIGVVLDLLGEKTADLIANASGRITLLRMYPVVHGGDWICSITTDTTRVGRNS